MAMPQIINAEDVRAAVERQEKIAANFKVEQFVNAGNNEIARVLKSFDNSLLPPPSHVTVTGGDTTTKETVEHAAAYFNRAGYKTEVKHSEADYHQSAFYYLVITLKG